jgi:hypothetical protein
VRADRNLGDGAYLFDGDGDLRAAVQYPCRYRCFDFAADTVRIDAAYQRRNEYVDFTNIGEQTLDLEGYRVSSPPYSYIIGPDSIVEPGEKIRLRTKGDPAADTHSVRYWGKQKTILGNNDVVQLLSPRWVRVACSAWGTKTC